MANGNDEWVVDGDTRSDLERDLKAIYSQKLGLKEKLKEVAELIKTLYETSKLPSKRKFKKAMNKCAVCLGDGQVFSSKASLKKAIKNKGAQVASIKVVKETKSGLGERRWYLSVLQCTVYR